MIWWLRKIDETNCFKVKTWGRFDLPILNVKQIHYKRIEVFTIRFNPKSIATPSSNLLTRPHASSESTDSFSLWIYYNTSTHACDFEISLKGFRLPSVVDLVAATRFYHHLIVDFTPVDTCVVRRYKTSQISQRVTHMSSKSLKNVAKVSLLYVDKLEWNPKHFRGLRPDLKLCRISFFAIFDWSNLILDRLSLVDCDFPFLQSARTWSLKPTPLSIALVCRHIQNMILNI